MTAIVIWLNKEKKSDERLWIAGDTLVQDIHIGKDLLRNYSKIFSLPVLCRKQEGYIVRNEVKFLQNVGFAFAGSTLAGQAILAKLNIILSLLVVDKFSAVVPLDDIGKLVSKIIENVITDLELTKGQLCEGFDAMVFGYCFKEKSYKVINFSVKCPDGAVEAKDKAVNMKDDTIFHIGSYGKEINEMVDDVRRGLKEKNKSWWRAPEYILNRLISDKGYGNVGGQIVRGVVMRDAIEIYANSRVLNPETKLPEVTLAGLGPDIIGSKIGDAMIVPFGYPH